MSIQFNFRQFIFISLVVFGLVVSPLFSVIVRADSSGPRPPGTVVSDTSSGGNEIWGGTESFALLDFETDGTAATVKVGDEGGGICFSPDTPITTLSGVKIISEIEVGDLVYSYNFSTQTTELKPVRNVIRNPISVDGNLYYHIYYPGGDFRVTGNHQLFANNQWIKAENLIVGDSLIRQNQLPAIITEIVLEPAFDQEVWSLTVADNHNFYAAGILAHNAGSAFDDKVRIVKGGVIGTTDRASVVAWPDALAYLPYGGETDLWGETWTPADINAANFGVAASVEGVGFAVSNNSSHYLKVSGFGFNIPEDATIDGIKMEMNRQYRFTAMSGHGHGLLDHIRLTVYYTPTTPPVLTTQTATNITTTTVTLNATITETGGADPTIRGFAYGLDDTYSLATTTEAGTFQTGAFTTALAGLSDNTTYHVRAYAQNSAGLSYASGFTFTTLEEVIPIANQTTTSGSRPTRRVNAVRTPPSTLTTTQRSFLIAQIETQLELLITELRRLVAERRFGDKVCPVIPVIETLC